MYSSSHLSLSKWVLYTGRVPDIFDSVKATEFQSCNKKRKNEEERSSQKQKSVVYIPKTLECYNYSVCRVVAYYYDG